MKALVPAKLKREVIPWWGINALDVQRVRPVCIRVLAPTFPNHVTLFWDQFLTSLCLSSQFSPLYNEDYNMYLIGLY